MSKYINEFLLVLVVSLVVRGFYLFLFSHCYSYDLNSWNVVANALMAGENPYQTTPFLNWPPLWMQLLFVFKKLSLALGVSLDSIIRMFLVVVESFSALLLYAAIVRFGNPSRAARLVMFGIALNPLQVFQVCQHCNFDVLVGFWILLAVYLVLRFQEQYDPAFWWGACFALGMGALTKTFPLCLMPLLMLSARKLKPAEWWIGAALAFGPIVLAMSILYVLAPHDVETKVLGYRSTAGAFGFGGVFTFLHWPRLLAAWPLVFEIVYGSGILVLSARLWSADRLAPRQVVALALVLLLFIPAFGPGYGPQYICWFVPLLVLIYSLAERRTRLFLMIGYAIAIAAYTIEYGFNFTTYGAFFLEIIQTAPLVRFGATIASKGWETVIFLPLWLTYLAGVLWFAQELKGQTPSGSHPQPSSPS